MDARVHATTVEFCFAVCCAERRKTAQSVTSSGDPPTETWQQPHAMGEISEATTVEFCSAVSSADRRNTESISVTTSGDSPAEAWQQPHQKGERPEPRAMTQTVSKGFHSGSPFNVERMHVLYDFECEPTWVFYTRTQKVGRGIDALDKFARPHSSEVRSRSALFTAV